MGAIVWPFLIYTVISFVVSYVLVEYGQKYLYDEVPPMVALKVAAGAFVMGVSLTWTRLTFDTMFTDAVLKTILVAIAWVGIFILIYRFQPVHGVMFALSTLLLLPGLASIVVESALKPTTNPNTVSRTPAKPLRRGTGVGAPAVKEAK